ncbi:MAG: phosphodiester glycosidase family protein [Clostridia bacterium]|nr:phosphodiester glycosidase family protein [Clostridia bacterium]
MEQKPKSKKTLLILIPVALILIAGAVFGILYFPAQKSYRSALTAAQELPFDEAYAALKDAIEKLDGNPLFKEKQSELTVLLGDLVCDHTYETAMDQSGDLPYAEASAILKDAIATLDGKPQYAAHCDALRLQLLEMTKAEIEYAIDEGKTEYALELMQTLTEEQATPFYDMIFAKAEAVAAEGDKFKAIGLLEPLGAYADTPERIEKLREGIRFDDAAAVFTGSNYDEGAAALRALGTEEGDAAAEKLLADRTARRASVRDQAGSAVAAGAWHTAWLDNGVVRFSGDARYTVPETDADRVFSGLCSIFALKDGKVIPFGETFGDEDAIAALSGVVDMGLGLNHALFLKEDGTVTGVGSTALGKLNTADWTDISDVAAGAWHSVGCKQDGGVLSVGNNDFNQCDTADWTGIVSVDAGLWHTAGLKADGTVVACGDNTYGQCDVSDWTDIAAISCGACFTVGLKTDGTVVACGDNAAGQCDVENWTEVAAIAAGAYHTAAVRMDGALLSAGCIPHDALPETPVFASDWAIEPIAGISARSFAEQTVYIEGLESEFGPWLYLDPNGAALICVDDSVDRTPLRADMLATANALPGGRVTQPEATGNVIHMDTEMPELQAQKAHAVVAFTGDYIGFTSNRKAVMIRNGVVYYDRNETTTLAVMPDGTLQFFNKGETTAKQLLDQGVKDSFSFGPLLVKDGKSAVDPTYGDSNTSYTMRVGFGYTDPYHYIVVVALRPRLYQFTHMMTADTLVGYGARLAYNFDGGHSTALVFMGRDLSQLSFDGTNYATIRALSDIVVFLENPAVQPPPEEPEPTPEEEPTPEPTPAP